MSNTVKNALPVSKLTKDQVRGFSKKVSGKEYGYKRDCKIKVSVRWDDRYGNGHNTFSITGDISGPNRQEIMGGCIHEQIQKHFPELKGLIKWHLCSSDGPMSYIQNTLYFANERDHYGYKKGEPCRWEKAVRFGDNPIYHCFGVWGESFISFLQNDKSGFDFEIIEIPHGPSDLNYNFNPKYTFGGYGNSWAGCPFDTMDEAERFLYALQNCNPKFEKVVKEYSEGKEAELENARVSAIWPEASLEDLRDKGKLEARLPALMKELKDTVESLGFTY